MPCYKWNSFSGGDSIVKKIDARRPAGDASFLRPIRVAGAGPCGDGPLRRASGGCSDVTGAVHDSRDANDAPTRWKMRSRPCGSSGTRRHRCVADAAAAACRAVAAALAGSLRDRRLATRGKFSPGYDCLRGPAGRATGCTTFRGGAGSPILRASDVPPDPLRREAARRRWRLCIPRVALAATTSSPCSLRPHPSF